MMKTKVWAAGFVVLLGISAATAWYLHSRRQTGELAVIILDGQVVRTVDLSQITEPEVFTVTGPCGTNTIRAERGRICVEQADCPDQICVHQGWSADSAAPIVCLPNRLVIEIRNAEQTDETVDAVVN